MKKFLLAVVVLMLIGFVLFTQRIGAQTSEAYDGAWITNEIHYHKSMLDNHEARINNLEEDVKTIQDKTNTAPSTKKVDVPPPPPAPSPPSQPPITPNKKAVKYEEVPEGENTNCKVTYDDGSTEARRWKTVTTHPDGSKSTLTNGQCGPESGTVHV